MTKPLVSVIVTTFNRKHLLDRCLQAVFEQDYPHFEVIVVDDASSDGTAEHVANRWGSKLKYIRHDLNRGVQFASNTGFREAKGTYLAFIGDDDYWIDPSKLTKQVQIFEDDKEERLGVVSCSVKVIRGDKSREKIISKPKNLVRHFLAENGVIYGSAALLRRTAFERAGQFREDLSKGTDSDVYRRVFILGYDAYISREVMLAYDETDETRMTALSERAILRSIDSLRYQFREYAPYLALYPSALSKRYQQFAFFYRELYKVRPSISNLKLANHFYLKSWLVYPFRLSPLVGLLRLKTRSSTN